MWTSASGFVTVCVWDAHVPAAQNQIGMVILRGVLNHTDEMSVRSVSSSTTEAFPPAEHAPLATGGSVAQATARPESFQPQDVVTVLELSCGVQRAVSSYPSYSVIDPPVVSGPLPPSCDVE